jgi:hypothetical protein
VRNGSAEWNQSSKQDDRKVGGRTAESSKGGQVSNIACLWRKSLPILINNVFEGIVGSGIIHVVTGLTGKINDVVIKSMMSSAYRRDGFNVYCGKAIWTHNEDESKNMVSCLISDLKDKLTVNQDLTPYFQRTTC